jgi:hypothetical protein
LVLP